ncbi:MAG: ABC transporter permease, partial [Mobilitalea sp.]
MMKFNPLYKRLKREFRDNFGRYLAIAIMFISTIAVISAFLVVSAGVKNVVVNNKTKHLLEDGQFNLKEELTTNANNAVTALGVSVYKNYYVNLKFRDNATLRLYKNREEVNLATIMEGELPNTKHEVAIDRLFAKNNKIKIGDTINGLKVTGFVALADYSSLFENNNDLLLNSFSFGVGVVTDECFRILINSNDVVYNYAYLSDKSNLSPKESYDLGNKIITALNENDASLNSFITAENNRSISFIDDDIGSDVPMMKVLLYIILVVMAFVFVVLIKHTIESESSMIGTLLASGYTKNEIIQHYISLPIIVTLISAVIGNILAYTIMLEPFKALYYNSYSLSPCTISVNIEALLLTTVLPVIMISIINYITLSKQLSISPLRFLRHDLKKVSKNGAIKLPNISFMSRFRIRVIIQNKSSYAILFVGIFMAGFLLLFGLCLMPVINHYVDSIDDTMLAKYQYVLKTPVEVENATKTTITSLTIYNKSAGKDMEVSFYGIDKLDGYSLKKNDIYFSETILKKLGVTIADEIEFSDEFTELSYILKPTDKINYTAGFAVIMQREKLNELLGNDSGYFNSYLTDEKLDIDESYVANIITPEDMTKIGEQMMSSFGGMIKPIVVMSIMIYLVLMYILTKLAIDKNAVCISFMKVFGYQNKQIGKVYLRSGTLTVIASLVLCLPIESLAAKASILAAMNKTSGYIEPYISWYIYLIIVAVGLASYF